MLDHIYLAYVQAFIVFLPGLALSIIALSAARAGVTGRSLGWALILSAAILSLWSAASMAASRANVFNVPATLQEPPVVLMVLIGGAVALWALARLTSLGRQITDAADPGLLVAFQIPRVMGGLFLVGWLAGDIPWQFALPAGLGDIWAGIAGYQAWQAVRHQAPDARAKLVRANVIGIGDFVIAVFTGIATSEGILHLWAKDAPNIINLHPLAMFPGYFVPLFLAFHLVLISRLRQSRALHPALA